jgi:tRNA(fMet)-specific endonuclease VapC
MQQQQLAGDTFAICIPVLAEVLFGIGIAPRAEQNLQLWVPWEQSFECYVPDGTDAKRAAVLQIQLRKQGRQLVTVDAFIAVTALRYDLTLLTTDKDFDAVPGLRRENWR